MPNDLLEQVNINTSFIYTLGNNPTTSFELSPVKHLNYMLTKFSFNKVGL
jgi:hypothetical protein